VIRYLSLADIAERLGLQASTVRMYRSEGRLPEPDAMTGPTPGWLPETIDEWHASRPGRGVGGGRPRKTTTDPSFWLAAREAREPGQCPRGIR